MALTSDNINLGSGELFCIPFDYVEAPAYSDISDMVALAIEDNRLSHVKNGATLSYAATYYVAKDDLELVSKTIASDETITFKSGLMTFVPATLEKLAGTAKAVTGENFSALQLGGGQNYEDKKYHFLFKHQDKRHYVYFIGTSQTSFDIAFQKGQETVIDAEFSCDPELTNSSGKKFRVMYFDCEASLAPTGLTAINTSAPGESDGAINGVTTAMEWKLDGADSWTACTTTSIADLSAGVYRVRYAATADAKASLNTRVVIE